MNAAIGHDHFDEGAYAGRRGERHATMYRWRIYRAYVHGYGVQRAGRDGHRYPTIRSWSRYSR